MLIHKEQKALLHLTLEREILQELLQLFMTAAWKSAVCDTGS